MWCLAGAATCKLHGEGINSQAAITMKHVPLEDEQAYSITCKLGNTKRGDIRILTSVGPIVVTIVDRTVRADHLSVWIMQPTSLVLLFLALSLRTVFSEKTILLLCLSMSLYC